MKLNTENLNPTSEFDLPGGGKIEVRVLTQAQIQEIRSQTRKKKPSRQGVMVEHVNDELESDLTWNAGIVSWSGVTDQADKQIKCTSENKKLLMTQCPEFAAVVANALDSLNTALEARTGLEVKN